MIIIMESIIKAQTPIDTPECFSSIADKLLNETVLMINSQAYRICEIEFYLYNEAHPDEYVHRHVDQATYGCWYFHKYNTGTYKNGTYKGMDISIGGSDGGKGGILIRSIYDPYEGKMIEGPCRCVNFILEKYGVNSINELVGEGGLLSVVNNDRGFHVCDASNDDKEPLRWGPRIGLSEKYPEYRQKRYRYVVGGVKKEKGKLVGVS